MKDLGTLNYFLGLEIPSSANGYYLSEAKYASNLLSRSGITDSATSSMPLDENVILTPFDGVPLDDPTLYRKLVGILIDLTLTVQILHLQFILLLNSWLLLTLFTLLLFFVFSAILKAIWVMVYSSPYSPLWFFLDSLMLIRWVIPLIEGLLLVIVSI